jgi:hypothetical protein
MQVTTIPDPTTAMAWPIGSQCAGTSPRAAEKPLMKPKGKAAAAVATMQISTKIPTRRQFMGGK